MLRIYRADRSEDLAGGLARLLMAPLPDPFAREVIAVPAKGVERWINQQLATVLGAQSGDGIAANIDYAPLARICGDAIAIASHIDPKTDPWHPDNLVWSVLDAIDDVIDEQWARVLKRHLGAGQISHRNGRRYATASMLAGLFSSYAAQRPGLLVDWAAGHNAPDADLAWQSELFRRVREQIGPSPAERLATSCAVIRRQPELLDLPERISVFGPTRFTFEQISVFAAISAHRDVHLWLPHPSPTMWDSLAGLDVPVTRAADASAQQLHHPLLRTLAHSVREMQMTLANVESECLSTESPASTLLQQLQDDIRNDRTPTPITRDSSLQVHSGHGPARQVEILRECLLGAFEDDPTLQPRDVLVMCPDVETYAPLIRAAFGQGIDGHPAHQLRVRLADRALNQTNDVLIALDAILALGGSRVTASEFVDLCAMPAVANRFAFGDSEVTRIREWIAHSGARWGLGDHQRETFGLGSLKNGTIGLGLDRVVLGVAADEGSGQWLGMALPLDVESNDILLAGRVAELADALDDVIVAFEEPRSAADWLTLLGSLVDTFTGVGRDDEWQLVQARRELTSALGQGDDKVLRLADVRAMLARVFEGRASRSNFRNGDLTVCTMVPMRSVPHRVIALLGVDDATFPRKANPDGDDVLQRSPLVGERDARMEDRQLLLDAIMACRQALMVFYTGADPVTGKSWPPAIPVAELLDVVRRMTGADITREHPLQPFDVRNFISPFSFDPVALAGAKARLEPVVVPAQPWAIELPAVPAGDVALENLKRFAVHPAQAFLRQRFGINLGDFDVVIRDELPIDINGLEEWAIGSRMLAAALAGHDRESLKQAEWRRNALPPKRMGMAKYREIEAAVGALKAGADRYRIGEPAVRDIDLDIGDGRRLLGTVPQIFERTIVAVSYSSLKPKDRMAMWVQLLALASQYPGDWRAVVVGKAKSGGKVSAGVKVLTAPDKPRDVLRDLVRIRDEGLRKPLQVGQKASEDYARWILRKASVPDALRRSEQSFTSKFGDRSTDDVIKYVWGADVSWSDFASAEFQRYSCELWHPLLECEK
ncbi:exodeoxyribonuclease V subunit gamma [Smaragdicoccus niigatensis]|uniref:exodeoxyribonuclease V subunit gamma n=1 Tax=Smaragdicoccus niigatensis TaxID=359359 RepID=UPI00037FB7EC|nr:exodeoxyribonuclease V subunit gamma [Smaragdicoccus niigatensis]